MLRNFYLHIATIAFVAVPAAAFAVPVDITGTSQLAVFAPAFTDYGRATARATGTASLLIPGPIPGLSFPVTDTNYVQGGSGSFIASFGSGVRLTEGTNTVEFNNFQLSSQFNTLSGDVFVNGQFLAATDVLFNLVPSVTGKSFNKILTTLKFSSDAADFINFGFGLTGARAISANQFAGAYAVGTTQGGFLDRAARSVALGMSPAAVPEPGALALLGLGSVVLIAARGKTR